MPKAVIIAHQGKENFMELSRTTADVLRQEGVEVYAEEALAEKIGAKLFSWEPETARQLDFAIVLGGDGTLLGAARKAMPYRLPLMGINLGHVGFLAEVGAIPRTRCASWRGEYYVDERTMVDAQLIRAGKVVPRCLGSTTSINKAGMSRLITHCT